MAQQYNDMYSEYNPSNRSPGSQRGYPQNGINRQTSRHFDNYGNNQLPGLYTAEDHAAQYDPAPHRFADRMPSATLHSNYQYENQSWNYGGAQNGNSGLMGGTGRIKTSSRRAGLPSSWMGQPPMPQQQGMNNYPINENPYDSQVMQQANERISSPNADGEELIPTAIVIKNIPFAVKKEQLVALMTDMRLPLPYAFNYHFDSGIFRGLAFANFTTSEETAQVISVMNHLELQGRKLRVEYKKMLPTMERERIEREKRQKRGQLEEQHRPLAPNQVPHPLHAQASVTSLSSNHHPSSPSPNSVRGGKPEIDLNDPVTLNFYNELLVFKNSDRETLIFPSTVPPGDRRTIHTLAHHMGLEHRSEGQGETRCVQILKRGAAISPPSHSQYHSYNDTQRRGLARAATIDFSEAREAGYHNHTLGRQGSGLLDIPGSPGVSGLGAAHNLRAAKSFADLRSYTPSPAHSTASFPVGLTSNIQRYTDAYGHGSAASGTPNLTPTSANRDEAFSLSNGLSNMNLYGPARNATGRIGQERENNTSNAGPIGSQRPVNTNSFNEEARNGTGIERQPRGPGTDWGVNGGFAARPRQNGHVNRGSGELDLNNFENGWDDNRAQDSSDRNGASTFTNQRY